MKIGLYKQASNFYEVEINDITLWFSYSTLVGFRIPKTGIICTENVWGPTTGKHLNYIQPDKTKRIKRKEFTEIVELLNLSIKGVK